ncbi:N-acetylneuraminate synthase family protein [Arthrobacter sp. ISL-28]|uniref:N-acetylneuraminate synthase family protein n=1 Tax=Arthrobacter sp. ISL-28 TaxID=2819108 RepID=UPI001BE9B497|nr:N-acetylneuraminate synthase family protein [Arthrobacter sp. ISL-28]MBT2519656.1 N-acetylneuraminate synthase family protein [Arthrobacter sp. ISL-28]
MIIERNTLPYIVFSEDPVLTGLQKITANQERIVFCVDEHGVLQGSFSDGDFRRWIVENPGADLNVSCLTVANKLVKSAAYGSSPADLSALMPHNITHLPLLDARGHLRAIAVDRSDVLRIGRHEIGPEHPAFLIAEIGNNHNGSVDLAKRLVDLASDAGADAVKFQLRNMEALYRQAGSSSLGEDLGTQYTLDLLSRFSLPAEELFTVFDHCLERGIDVLCTPWDSSSIQSLVDYGLPALKIASADLTNHELLQDAASRGVPLIASTGMSREDEIRESAQLLRSAGAAFALLHTQSTYPAPFKDVNLAYMDRLAEIGQCVVGYSGHERGYHIPVAAVARGAKIIEKHFTVDTTMEGNDHTVSLLPEEFAQMVRRVREVEESIGDKVPRTVSTGEMMNRINLAKSLVAARPVAKGQVIVAEDVAVKSPGRGLQPNALPLLLGRTSPRDIVKGDFFYEGDLRDKAPRGRDFSFRRPWGLPVRYHDYQALIQDGTPDFLEFHFSYKDLEIDPEAVFMKPLDMGFTTHLPDLFSGDFLVDLAAEDKDHWERSIAEVQRTIDISRSLTKWFTREEEPVVVVTMGGFTKDRHLIAVERPPKYERIAQALKRLDTGGVRIAAQTLPPYPWLMGGQQFHNLFLDPTDTAEFAEETGIRLCLDVSHTKLAANFLGIPFSEAVDALAPHTIHLHMVDATGVDGEGVQVGEGEVDFAALAQQLDRLCPDAGFIPEIWQGHVNDGAGFWTALERLEAWY